MMEDGIADIVIIGGGGIGSAVAYFLMRLAGPSLRVAVYERDPSYATASTALAAGGIRQQFSTPENILMSQFGFEFLAAAGQELATEAGAPEVGLKPLPYLRLAAADQAAAICDQVALQRSLGATPELLDQAELARRFPWLNLDDVALGVLGGAGEGLFDPYGLLQGLRRKAIDLGATFRTGEVIGFDRDPAGLIAAVRLADGRRTVCGRVVNAAGPLAGAVARLAGLALPVGPVKAHSFAFRPQHPFDGCPVVLDHVQPLQFKPEGAVFVAACPREPDMEEPDFTPDYSLFEELAWPALAHRSARFEAVKLVRAWVGHLEWNAFDSNPVLGPHPDCENFIFANGFSGHGAQHLPAAGRAIAELLVEGGYRTLDLSRFGYQRLVSGIRLPELV